ncbi:AAA domain-containing protein [Bacillus sp. Cr_A10]|uniref:AAA domain-containing protein n=1 Tax=Bacillus sp. Cr_A10 TaxID=3033993 RepID=UPI0023DC7A23|nr:AAA domain-containing protein [Bacillus sp. Cr_A10]MDF2067729.1 AAA domain-containing protein [Bacillus sp. Cr_A10]
MEKELTRIETFRSNLIVTNNARKGILEWSTDEHAFFKMQESFAIYMEKRPVNSHGNTSLSLYFDNEMNRILSDKLNGKVAVMECVLQNDGFLATGFHVRGEKTRIRTNRRLAVNLKFVTARNNGAGLPIQLHTKIRELPIAEERSEYVKKRITSWEGYLKIQERNADIADITTEFSKIMLNEDFSRMTLIGTTLNGNEWNKIKGLSVALKGYQYDIGDVLKVDRSKKTIEIDLKPKIRDMARRNQLNPKTKEAVFSNFATLSQIRRLRKGFEDLQNGLAANANLEKILFEDRPAIRITNKTEKLKFHNQLNEFQQEAVTGAMSAKDLYVIQGPPGTGKTTVISEICQQNAKAGLRTLVASQSNLAVDNALSRLLSNKDIRILRFGRTESIEEEGKKFIEENVGQYWKDQTLSALQRELNSHPVKKEQLSIEITTLEQQIDSLQTQLVLLKEKITQKENAKIEHTSIMEEIKGLKRSLILLKKEQEELEKTKTTLEKTLQGLQMEITKMEEFIHANPSGEQLKEKLKLLEAELEIIKNQLYYQQIMQEVSEAEKLVNDTRQKFKMRQLKIDSFKQFLTEIPSTRKFEQLKSLIKHYEFTPLSMLEKQIEELDKLIEKIQSFEDWEELNNRLQSAIVYIESIFKKNNISLQNVGSSGVFFDSSYSVKEIHQFIDIMKRMLTSGEIDLEKLKVYWEGLNVRKKFVWKQGTILNNSKSDSTKRFQTIKLELEEQLKRAIIQAERDIYELKNNGTANSEKLNVLMEKSKNIKIKLEDIENIQSPQKLEEELQQKEILFNDLKKTEETLKQYINRLELKKNEKRVSSDQLESYKDTLSKSEIEGKRINSEGLEQERKLKALDELLRQNLEEERELVVVEIEKLSEKKLSLTREKERLPITQELQNEWFSLLSEANDHDLDEIRKLYVRHANVIGTTCVASARKEFMDNYPVFDVVIIDEVSKATPPELLLPMLKGKKIILVGDHHQLPPLVGEDTLDETLKVILEESDSFEEKDELKKLLKESLFERLFKNLPKSNKTMLAIQYRMHESIMETITPFYAEENYRLQCGLVDSDTVRDHLLDSHYVKRSDHLIWMDIPNERSYFEEKVKDGKSRFNQGELNTIRDVLMDLDKATESAKSEGRMGLDERKSIGVISFYGEQVKRIDRLIQQETNFKNLTFRTGTVDKFQGMEMDVIILSMVRNNKDNNADIGFANDYRRLNVALSRARELLVLVGSTEMFTQRAKRKDAREMYSGLLEVVKNKDGLKDIKGNVIGVLENA